MIDFEQDKPYIIGAVALIGVGSLLYLFNRGNNDQMSIQGQQEPTFGNDTLFIPTNEYNIHYVNGDQTVSNVDNRTSQSNTATNGGVINQPTTQPNVPTQPPTKAPEQPATKPKVEHVIFSGYWNTYSAPNGTVVGYYKPSAPELVDRKGDWVKVKTYRGQEWANPKLAYKQPSKTITHKIQKGETLWSIAERYTGSGKNYLQIAKENNIADPNKIYYDRTIKITVGAGN